MRTITLSLLLTLSLIAISCREDPVTPPAPDGSASFWSRVGDEGTITITIDGETVGALTSHFPLGTPSPNCGDEGTVTIALAPGEHQCRATSSAGSTWTFRFATFSDQCDTHELLDD